VGLVFGGKSGEHEVSIKSANNIYDALDKNKYEVTKIFVDKNNHWDNVTFENIDVVFPIIHGTYGEDGCFQRIFEIMDKAYVGPGVLGSAVGMDKDVMKRLLLQAGIPVTKFQILKKGQSIKIDNYPVFVKPVNMGSSVGISKVSNKEQLDNAVKLAFEYDTKVIIEDEVVGDEIEVSVLGNDNPIASVPGRIRPNHDFYDYEAKYLDANGAEPEIPAKISVSKTKEIQELAIKAYKVLECYGMARVDMFLTPTGKIILNEINTLPGFTNISMYPKLWGALGSYSKLLDRLIQLALEKKKEKDNLKRSFV
jgi:D-alanine-D-alanine ligase